MNCLILIMFFTTYLLGAKSQTVISWQPKSLILASDDDPFFLEFDLSNEDRDITEHRQIYHGYNDTNSVTYDATTTTLFWSGSVDEGEDRTTHILSTVNNSGVVNTLYSNDVSIMGLAVDSERQKLFFSMGWDSNTLGIISTDGQNYQSLGNVRSKCFMSPMDLTLDTANQMIYLACYYRLIRMTYSGADKEEMVDGSRIYGVDFHKESGTLYYNDNKYLYTTNPTGSSRFEYYMKSLPSTPTSIKRYGNHLFVSFLELDDIFVINLQTRQTNRITNIPGDQYHRWTLAYVPCRFGNFRACRVLSFGEYLMNYVHSRSQ